MTIHLKHQPSAEYQQRRMAHWDQVARHLRQWTSLGRGYQAILAQYYRFYIPPQQRVLEIGCGAGDLLAAVSPSLGVGVDFSGEMVRLAAEKHPDLHFIQADAHSLPLAGAFDFIILSDLTNDLWDIQALLENLRPLCQRHTRLIFNNYSRLWELPLRTAQSLGWTKPNLEQNWLTTEDLVNLLYLTGYQVIKNSQAILFPFQIPLLSSLANRYLAKLFPLNHLTLTNFTIARPTGTLQGESPAPIVSVIVPARNEAGNIAAIFKRVPEMGGGTELVFVEGHSTDDTYEKIGNEMNHHTERHCKLYKQTGKGKGDAVRLGFSAASGDILMILDADLTVPPEDLPRFYDALVSDKGEFINGVRLIYPMEDQAMQFLNNLGNKFFSLAFSWLLGQLVKDTLCGTKVLWKTDYETIAANRSYFGEFDPFGDFDLLFGAARLNRHIIDLPVRYRARTYGTTNISRWKHGWMLLQMVAFAAGKLKFV